MLRSPHVVRECRRTCNFSPLTSRICAALVPFRCGCGSRAAADFEADGFTKTVCNRVAMLEAKGVTITQDVLVKVGIPLPGSDHPVAGKGQRSQQHLEELTSLVPAQ